MPSRISLMLKHNVDTFRRQPLAELSGSLGDLGTFLPIVIALTEGHQISFSSTLVFTGVYNILTGFLFGIPLPVQPMKAIAAVAILKHLRDGEIAAAGLFVSACIFLMSVTGLLAWFSRVIPIPVVKGIQVGAGLSLIIAAGAKVLSSLSWLQPDWSDNYIWVVVGFIALFAINVWPKVPYALIVFLIGILFAIIEVSTQSRSHDHLRLRIWHPYTQLPSPTQWQTGIIDAGIGQLPLTTLNSIIAVTHLATDLLPEVPTPSVTSIGLSVSGMNILGCWFGVMPVCHGSGGLAAQYRFGARSGASVICLGTVKLILGLFFGESLTALLRSFPTAFLSVMIIAAGLELASVGESLNTERARDLNKGSDGIGVEQLKVTDQERKQRWTVMMVTAGLLVAFRNDAVGFVAGLVCHWSYHFQGLLKQRHLQNDSHSSSGNENQALLS